MTVNAWRPHKNLTSQTTTAFGRELCRQRLACRRSIKRLARHAGVDHSHISRLEGGSRQPSREMVMTIADALGVCELDRDRLLATAGYLPASDYQRRAIFTRLGIEPEAE